MEMTSLRARGPCRPGDAGPVRALASQARPHRPIYCFDSQKHKGPKSAPVTDYRFWTLCLLPLVCDYCRPSVFSFAPLLHDEVESERVAYHPITVHGLGK